MQKMMNKWFFMSMTGAGKAQKNSSHGQIDVFIRSVNHKNLDFKFKLPSYLMRHESDLVKALTNNFERGRIDCHINIASLTTSETIPFFNESKVLEVIKQYSALIEKTNGLKKEITLSDLLVIPHTLQEVDFIELEKNILNSFLNCFTHAVEDLRESRKKEGHLLKKVIGVLMDNISENLLFIKKSIKNDVKERFLGLKLKVEELFKSYQIDDNRIYQEAALLAQRADFTEEVDRLEAHLLHFDHVCQNKESKGRKLDFICQEMLREANTLLSKAFCSEVIKSAIDLKSNVENLREQVQNIE